MTGLTRMLRCCCLVAAAASCLAQAPGPHTQVRLLQGRPTFFVDGAPYTKPLFATYVPTESYYREMAEVGCEVFNFQTNCSACNIGFSTPTWTGPDQWDFSQMDERAGLILAARPDGLILPRIYIGTPQWWWEAHPGDMIVLDHGGTVYQEPYNPVFNMKRPYACIVSPRWRADMGAALRRTIEHMQASSYGGHIFGYEISALGSEEWYHLTVNQLQLGDYNPHMAAAFRDWLRARYGTVEALRAAWGQDDIDFEGVVIPGKPERIRDPNRTFRDPAAEMNVIDFYQFHSDVVADTIDYFAGIVKDATGGRKVVGAFYDYLYEFRGGPEFGHNAGGRIVRSDNIDFICAPPSYYQRQLGSGAECYRRPFLPGTLHGKLWFHDNDLASYRFLEIMRARNVPEETIAHYATQIYPTPTAQESIWLYERAAGFTLCEGIYESFFDLHGGYFDSPQLLEALGPITDLLGRAKDHDRSSVAQVLILADEASLAYGAFRSDWPAREHPWGIHEMLMAHQPPFIKAGVPFDSGLLSDLELIDWDRYRLVVFLNTWQVSDAQRAFIADRVARDGRVLVWTYAPGLFAGNRMSETLMKDLSGIRVRRNAARHVEPQQMLNQAGRQWVRARSETPPQAPFGLTGARSELFWVDDLGAEVLGYLADEGLATLVRKQMSDWQSWYTLTAVFTPEVVRALAREAGVHVWADGNDAFYANRSFMTLNVATAGKKAVQLPYRADVYHALTGYRYFTNVDRFELSLMEGETALLHYERRAP